MLMSRILVIRGGAIGDFILTLPALKALRDAQPDAHIEILGYKHIAEVAQNRFYVQAVRSIEYGPLSRFFVRNSELPAESAGYFATFDFIISYLYDPDRIFEENLRRCGVENLLCGPAKIGDKSGHAARQLARPIEQLGITVMDLSEKIFPSVEDRQFAHEFLCNLPRPVVAIHPGSGGKEKNWPLQNWIELVSSIRDLSAADDKPGRKGERTSLVVVSGEADESQTAQFERDLKHCGLRFAKNLELPRLAAVLEQTIFVGHDSGISHLAAAAGANCILLFGPTNPKVWAPRNENVRVLRPQSGRLNDLDTTQVRIAVTNALRPEGSRKDLDCLRTNPRSRLEISRAISMRSQ